MRPLLRPFLPVLALALAAAPLRAQAAAYARAPGDTLRYREVTESMMEVTLPQGTVPQRTQHEARVAVVFGRADTVRAWYETLAIGATSPQGTLRPDTKAVLGRPFTLLLDRRGRTETLGTPEFPAAFANVSDLRQQFTDFFVPLPAGPLVKGTQWRDSTSRTDTGTPGRTSRIERVAEYLVTGDTTVAGVRATRVVSIVRQRLRSEGSQGGRTVVSELAGEERGEFYWHAGRLVGRARAAELAGMLRLGADDTAPVIPQRMRYTNSLEIVR